MANRIHGQIWIDKNSPYRIKYFVNNTEYETSVSQIFVAESSEAEALSVGMVVAVSNSGKIKRAVFPDDLESVIGIVGSKKKVETASTPYYNISISISDKLVLGKSEVNNVFVDLSESKGTNTNYNHLYGAPIYWFIGRQKKSGTTYSYVDSSKQAGKVTFNTPTGFQWGVTNITENEFNIGYDNLPVIGTVSSIITDTDGSIKELILNTNFHGFDKTIGWSYPYTDNSTLSRGILTPTNNVASIDIHHGLFPNSKTVKARCFCDVIAMNTLDSIDTVLKDTEYQVSAIVDNFYDKQELENASGDRHTHIEVHTPDTYRYNIHGTVVYKFQKGVNS